MRLLSGARGNQWTGRSRKKEENFFFWSDVDFLSTRMRLISSPLQSVSKATDEISWNFTQLHCDISATVGRFRVLASLSLFVLLSYFDTKTTRPHRHHSHFYREHLMEIKMGRKNVAKFVKKYSQFSAKERVCSWQRCSHFAAAKYHDLQIKKSHHKKALLNVFILNTSKLLRFSDNNDVTKGNRTNVQKCRNLLTWDETS